MGFHTFDVGRADNLEDPERYQYLSLDELLALFDPEADQTVADLGSGTGFYTDDVAPHVGTLYAVDVQEAMHEYYREKGAPHNVTFVVADVEDLPFEDDELDGAYSTMTYHEFASEAALAELARTITPGGLLGVADWSASGAGEEGPPTDERFSLATAMRQLTDAGFTVEYGSERRETFVLRARRDT
ncbi:class I SAM-dependent methyltransferase [Halomarina ordinaria]|uniref:Class I SAM-dependent methyltransferase n=1 Tax=Halomarina ordinaria TaxID=3033939 RepID=A0ABD5U5L4_9EURY|nr:methyltransferase domain-containing protein [Halomarina sp. PSRA2]